MKNKLRIIVVAAVLGLVAVSNSDCEWWRSLCYFNGEREENKCNTYTVTVSFGTG